MKTSKQRLVHLLFFIITLGILYPILFIISNSFKPLKEAYNTILNLIPQNFTLDNFTYLFKNLPLLEITWNTFFVATVITVVKLIIAFFAAYSFTYYRIKGKKTIYFLIISTLFIPFTASMIPNYLLIAQLNLIDTSWGVILPQLADAMGIFLLTQTMRGIPVSLLEVAEIDNISQWTIMRKIVFPLSRHAITSTGIWFFITSWNEFVWPVLILKSTERYTLPLAMQTYISSEGGTNFTVAMSISLITMIVPLLLYTLFQKYIIGTFISTGIK
ncbi:carbohydrate ABC transporter permease [Carnobacterium gallinarum]|uniref:carbohydrate ABC transporter permease n=1 Tax=Carnobacterium gallinarum TaxID=2749 RepID=UPI00055750F4|nr:carbohydrate ABC transporter permease [Carnobacterium gallinarum]